MAQRTHLVNFPPLKGKLFAPGSGPPLSPVRPAALSTTRASRACLRSGRAEWPCGGWLRAAARNAMAMGDSSSSVDEETEEETGEGRSGLLNYFKTKDRRGP